MFIFPRNERNVSPPPPTPSPPKKNNVAIHQVLIVMGEQHCFGGEGEMSNIYNKKWKNKLSVPILLPLIVGSDTNSLGSWRIKGAGESALNKDSSA